MSFPTTPLNRCQPLRPVFDEEQGAEPNGNGSPSQTPLSPDHERYQYDEVFKLVSSLWEGFPDGRAIQNRVGVITTLQDRLKRKGTNCQSEKSRNRFFRDLVAHGEAIQTLQSEAFRKSIAGFIDASDSLRESGCPIEADMLLKDALGIVLRIFWQAFYCKRVDADAESLISKLQSVFLLDQRISSQLISAINSTTGFSPEARQLASRVIDSLLYALDGRIRPVAVTLENYVRLIANPFSEGRSKEPALESGGTFAVVLHPKQKRLRWEDVSPADVLEDGLKLHVAFDAADKYNAENPDSDRKAGFIASTEIPKRLTAETSPEREGALSQ